ncbi:hypothetical protein Nepgr_031420 [Nepenthes gracilis]|uniref:(+)-neomenthol dehydrogenase-like n=1 Tax=Nepenthes gracilis TaxID=150966 RepID=A0AAD3Y4S6_NEPGR|nr:hypothetical protein Nepgr_031420 [Nepenthes gracilis]
MAEGAAANFLSTKRYAVVTGSNKGIGFELCKQLASNGVIVVLTSRDEKKGKAALENLSRSSGLSDKLVFHRLDVTEPTSIDSLADFVKTEFGKLDILVNNAGLSGCTVDVDALNASGITPPAEPITWEKYTIQNYELAEECVKTNYYGAKRTIEALIPLLLRSDSPRIVNVSSYMGKFKYQPNEWAKGVLGDTKNLTEERIEEVLDQFLQDFKEGKLAEKGWPSHFSGYKLSKATVNGLTKVMARKYPSICINAVCPGAVQTEMNTLNGVLSVEDGAANFLRLALMPPGGPSGLYFDQKEPASPYE